MMSILHIVSGLERGGGVEQLTFNLVTNLRSSDWKNVVCCLQNRGSLGEKLQSMGIEVISLGMCKSLSFLAIWKNMRRFLQLTMLIRREEIDIVHTHEFFSGTIGRLGAWLANTLVIIITLHKKDKWKKWYHMLIDRLLAKVTDRVITNSKAVKNFTANFEKIESQKFQVIYNGIDVRKFTPRDSINAKRKLGINSDTPVIGSVGRMAKEKGYEYLLKALPKILSKLPLCKFVLVGGDGVPSESTKEKIHRLVKELRISDKVIFTGLRSDIPELLSTFDVFVLPSLGEGFGIAAAEAMAMSKPIVASRVDGIPEVVEDGVTGILVPPRDPDALAKAILLLLQEKETATKMGIVGRERIKELFTAKTMAKKYEQLYKSLVKRKKDY